LPERDRPREGANGTDPVPAPSHATTNNNAREDLTLLEDAVREAGRDQGVFRVAAEIVRDSERDQLHLRCEDNGVGIAHGNLERVFDKGFSTKSRETNYGIGLHWCANAISALGGRIWAVSDGPGRGASMHLMLPLTIRPSPLNP